MADLTTSANVDTLLGAADFAAFRTSLSLGNVDNTSDSTKNAASATLTNKTLSAAIHTGVGVHSGTRVTTASAMAALAIDVTKGFNTKSISADQTFTFSGTPGTTNQWFGMFVTNSDSSAHTLTIPISFSMARAGAITTVTIPASGKLFLQWNYDGSTYHIFGDPPATTGSGSFLLSAGTAAIASGKTLTVSNTLTFTGTDASSVAFGAGGTVLYTGSTLTSCTVDGTNLVGYRGAPQNSQTAAYTTVLGDAGKCIFHPSSDNNARTFTIDSNANVAYPVGTILEFINMAAASVTIAITSDTLTLLPAGSTGSRTLAQYGRASAEKISSTAWVISGNSALT